MFEIIAGVSEFPNWRSKVRRVELLPAKDGHSQFREIGSDGAILYSIDTVIPDQRLVTRIADPKLPFGGTWTYEITPRDGGSTLRITEDGEVYNPIFRFVSRFVLGHATTIDRYLRDLEQKIGRSGATG